MLVFDCVIGDNPSCRTGCPIALGPKLKFRSTVSIERLELIKEIRPARRRRVARLRASDRDAYLVSQGYSLAEIDATAAAIRIIKEQRVETNSKGSKSFNPIRRTLDGTFKSPRPRKMAGMAA